MPPVKEHEHRKGTAICEIGQYPNWGENQCPQLPARECILNV